MVRYAYHGVRVHNAGLWFKYNNIELESSGGEDLQAFMEYITRFPMEVDASAIYEEKQLIW